jgi:hypothetical protein
MGTGLFKYLLVVVLHTPEGAINSIKVAASAEELHCAAALMAVVKLTTKGSMSTASDRPPSRPCLICLELSTMLHVSACRRQQENPMLENLR